MNSIIKKINASIQNMNNISQKVIKYGFIAFIILIAVSLLMNVLNKYVLGDILQVAKNSIDVFISSFSVLAITVIGGIIMDYISKNEN